MGFVFPCFSFEFVDAIPDRPARDTYMHTPVIIWPVTCDGSMVRRTPKQFGHLDYVVGCCGMLLNEMN